MIRSRIWREKRDLYVCALCRNGITTAQRIAIPRDGRALLSRRGSSLPFDAFPKARLQLGDAKCFSSSSFLASKKVDRNSEDFWNDFGLEIPPAPQIEKPDPKPDKASSPPSPPGPPSPPTLPAAPAQKSEAELPDWSHLPRRAKPEDNSLSRDVTPTERPDRPADWGRPSWNTVIQERQNISPAPADPGSRPNRWTKPGQLPSWRVQAGWAKDVDKMPKAWADSVPKSYTEKRGRPGSGLSGIQELMDFSEQVRGGNKAAAPRVSRPEPSPSTDGMERLSRFAEEGPKKPTPAQLAASQSTVDWASAFQIEERPPFEQQRDNSARGGFAARAPPTEMDSNYGAPAPTRRRGADWGQLPVHGDADEYARPERPERRQRRGGEVKRSRHSRDDDEGDWDDDFEMMREARRRQRAEEKAARKSRAAAAEARPQIFMPEYISVTDLASALKVKPDGFIQTLEELGFEEITEDSLFTGETAGLVAQEFGFDVTVDDGAARDVKPRAEPVDKSSAPLRPPIVAIMGHVDHGKTTLLDYLRKSSIVAQEHGGITQHLGAFMVKMSSGKPITFLDTPGHAAFLAMRQRGAEVTDIVILVVAADDSVKPQTLEALKHATDAKVPMIVAITKVDKPEARIEQVKTDLSSHGVELEDFGGDVQVVCVSGKTGQGMGDLEENIITLSEILDVHAEVDGLAEGWVLEASVKPVGKAATVLVKRGTLRPGDCIVAGTTWARVRALRNEAGHEVDEALPGAPVEVLGWRDELPDAGDSMIQAPDESRARTAVDYRNEMKEREKTFQQVAGADRQRREEEAKAAAQEAAQESAEAGETAAPEAPAAPGVTIVNFIIKGDVVGSVEAVSTTIQEIGNNEIRPRILSAAAGRITESEVEYAATANGVIINFNVPIPGHIKNMAETSGVRIVDRNVIYHVADDVRAVMTSRLPVRMVQKVLGEAEVLQIFPINIRGRVFKNIAGCKIKNGMVKRSDRVRVMRDREKVFDGQMESLKHGKKDVSEMKKGSECGIGCLDFQEVEVGDLIQTYEEIEERRTL